MKGFQQFQQVTGGKTRGPGAGGLGGGKDPFAAKPPVQQPKPNNNRNKNKNRNKGGGGAASTTTTTTATGTGTSGTSVTGEQTQPFISTLATEKPLDYFSGQLTGLGELTGNGPSTYENWLQNQFFNEQYGKFMAQKPLKPESSFDTYLAETYGPNNATMDDAARNQFNSLTASQRGDFNNPFSGGTGRWQFWG